MSTRKKAVFGSLQATHAQNYILAIPMDELYQHISSLEYHTILRYRLMIPLHPIDEVCPIWYKVCLDTLGEKAIHCKDFCDFKYKHDFIRDVLFYIFRWAEVCAKKEAHVNFLFDPQDERSTFRPTDVMVYGGKRETYKAGLNWDFTSFGIRDQGFNGGTNSSQSRIKQIGQMWENMLWQSTYFYTTCVWHFWLPNIIGCLPSI